MPDHGDPELAPTLDERAGGEDEPLAPEAERYRVDGMIGRGGMGVVSAYYDRRIGRRVACKELRRDVGDDPGSRARFLREARVQGRLEHPSIVPVYDLGIGPEGEPYFTMKTVRGTTLAEILENGQMVLHRLLAAFSRVCLAIDYAHSQGVLHRDLKPANVMFGEYGEVYVLDWGLAKIVGEQEPARASIAALRAEPDATSASTILGTPGYMAPEQIDDASGVSATADVYSLGAILFEILAGEPLHERGLAALDSTRSGVDARPSVRAPRRDVPPELDAVVVRATSLAAASRPSARELSEIIDKYLEGERDLELRKTKAAGHAEAALTALSNKETLAARREAMQEINRALVLDPANRQAQSTLHDLLTEPPESVPEEVLDEVDRQDRRNLRWISAVGAAVYASVLAFVVFFWWMGIRDPWPIVAFAVLMVMSGCCSLAQALTETPNLVVVAAALVLSSAAFAFATRITSPLLVLPAAIAINAVGYGVFAPRKMRPLVVLAACAAFGVPLALELAGVISPTFVFEHGRLQILPVTIDFPATPAILLVSVATMSSFLIGVVIIGYIRDRLSEAERRIFLYSWQLRELLPREVRAKSDPLKFTHKRRSPLR